MVLVRKQLKLNLLAVAAAALTLPAWPAWAVGPPTWAFPAGRTLPVADSTTNHVISVGVPLPPPCDATCLQNLVGISTPVLLPPGAAGTNIPPGYKEVTVATGNRYLGSGAAGLAAAGYYYGLGYSPLALDNIPSGGQALAPSLNNVATGTANLTASGVPYGRPPQGSVVVASEWYVDAQGGSGVTGFDYYVIEPQGTRTVLQKVVTSTQTAFGQPYLNNKYQVAVPAGHMSWGLDATTTITPICQAEGYTDYVPGTVVSTYKGAGCNDFENITTYQGGWVNATYACYHYILTGLSCYK